MTPEQVIKKEYGNGKNFMTPNVLDYGWIVPNRIAYELSRGRGIENQPIFGVTIVAWLLDGRTQRMTDLSDMFYTRRQAQAYIAKLTQERKGQ